ncbi:MAG: hypothetical protein WAW86_00710 [Gammaproteobacteria bacterium]
MASTRSNASLFYARMNHYQKEVDSYKRAIKRYTRSVESFSSVSMAVDAEVEELKSKVSKLQLSLQAFQEHNKALDSAALAADRKINLSGGKELALCNKDFFNEKTMEDCIAILTESINERKSALVKKEDERYKAAKSKAKSGELVALKREHEAALGVIEDPRLYEIKSIFEKKKSQKSIRKAFSSVGKGSDAGKESEEYQADLRRALGSFHVQMALSSIQVSKLDLDAEWVEENENLKRQLTSESNELKLKISAMNSASGQVLADLFNEPDEEDVQEDQAQRLSRVSIALAEYNIFEIGELLNQPSPAQITVTNKRHLRQKATVPTSQIASSSAGNASVADSGLFSQHSSQANSTFADLVKQVGKKVGSSVGGSGKLKVYSRKREDKGQPESPNRERAGSVKVLPSSKK